VLTILLFRFSSPLAAVFELSICAGLITVVFISTISLAEPLSYKDLSSKMKGRYKRYIFLPLILIVVASFILWLPDDFIMSFNFANTSTAVTVTTEQTGVREIIWNQKENDLLGQIIILLTGVFGVVVLFKERKEDE
jgi:NADH-quinone oxidoreductase subunit J